MSIGEWLQTLVKFFGRLSSDREMYRFLKHQKKQLMLEPVQSHPSDCGFYTIYAAFNLFIFRQDETTGLHDVNVVSFISNNT